MTGDDRQLRRALIALCVTEITSWGTLYFSLPAMLVPLSRSTGWPGSVIMGAFSAGLVVTAVAGIVAGRLLDRLGPQPVMTAGSFTFLSAFRRSLLPAGARQIATRPFVPVDSVAGSDPDSGLARFSPGASVRSHGTENRGPPRRSWRRPFDASIGAAGQPGRTNT